MALGTSSNVRLVAITLSLLAVVLPTPVRAWYAAAESLQRRPIPRIDPGQQVAATSVRSTSGAAFPELEAFVTSMTPAAPEQLMAVFVPDTFLMPVTQQPSDNPQFVAPVENTITEFAATGKFDSTGLLAHNYLAGENFFTLREGQEFFLVLGDGSTSAFIVTEIQQYQALQPQSPYSDFVDLETSDRLSASQLFKTAYGRAGTVVFQTCIADGGEASWGRLFVIAEPMAG